MPSRGLLVGIEGIDAAGKRTQSSLLEAWLHAKKVSVDLVSFPEYSTTIGGEIRAFLLGTKNYPPEVRHMLFAANRWERKRAIEDRLERRDVVIVNRYTESNLAYGVANGLPIDWLLNLEAGLPKTDLVLVLDATPSTFYNRRGTKKDTYENDAGLQERARRAYTELGARFGWVTVNASSGIQETSQLVTEAVSKLLASRGRAV
ncbi:MAG TPA: dTMP kinase [Nitrososphaerales archaeon]|nr:dTMP kinase [Nitrososphaerales archaeon]